MTGARVPAGPPNGHGSPAPAPSAAPCAARPRASVDTRRRPRHPRAAPRQRWRLYLRMPAARLPGELPAGAGAWASLLERCGLPLAGEPGRGRVVPAAQLPLGISGEREFVDVVLAARLPAAEVRARVAGRAPSERRAGRPPRRLGRGAVGVGRRSSPRTIGSSLRAFPRRSSGSRSTRSWRPPPFRASAIARRRPSRSTCAR